MPKQRRYWIFAGDTFYPLGGMMDFKDSYITLGDVMSHIKARYAPYYDWWQVVDSETGAIIEQGGRK